MNNDGKGGCGCLVTILIVFLIILGLSIHPLSLKFIGRQFVYNDKIFASDVIYVPRFAEDKNGEVYDAAFREYRSGNGKLIWIENEMILETSLAEIVGKKARLKGIKDDAIRKMEISGNGITNADRIKEAFAREGVRKAIIIVPEYASRRFRILYGDSGNEGKTLFLIKAAKVSFFTTDGWWKEAKSRILLAEELSMIASSYFDRIKKGGAKGKK